MQNDSMNAIDVAYNTEVAIESKSTEQLTAEANIQYRQAESLAAMSLATLADVGRKIAEIKKRIPHGTFEDWCAENLVFSKKQAERYMKLASKMDDENSLFSKTSTLTDIGISRVWALLAAPEDIAEEVVENNDVEDMTVRELNEEIARLKKEKAEAERMARMADNNLADSRKENMRLQNKLNETITQEEYDNLVATHEEEKQQLQYEVMNGAAEKAEIEEKLTKAKEDLKKAKQKLKDAEAAKDEEVQKRLAVAQSELEEKHADDIKKAKEEGAADAAASLAQQTEEISQLEAKIEKLEAEKAKLSNTALLEFKIRIDRFQDMYFEFLEYISDERDRDSETAEKMKMALQKVIDGWRP